MIILKIKIKTFSELNPLMSDSKNYKKPYFTP